MTRRGALGVFVDLPFVAGPDATYCQDAFWLFLERVLAGFDRATVLGRLFPDRESPCYRVADAIEFQPLPQFASLYAPGEVLRGLPELVRRIRGPVEHSDSLLLALPHPWSLVLWAAARLRGKRVVFVARGDMLELVRRRAPMRGRRLTLALARLLDAAFVRLARSTPVLAVGAPLAARYGGRPILVSTVRDVPERVTPRRTDSRSTRLLWVGRLEREKRPDLALRTLAALRARRDDVLGLDVAGRGPLLAEVERLAKDLGVSECVRFLGYVPWGPKLRELYAGADALLHTSATEGFPQVFLEAMAAGLPIVTTAAGGIPDLLEDGAQALLVRSGDAESLAAALERLFDDPALAERLRAAGLELARAHTLELEAERFLRLWDAAT